MTRAASTLRLLAFAGFAFAASAADTLRLHPDNPHYFQWRGQPLIIIGSGEHYGAVLNADLDNRAYLETLGRDGLNHTRLFTGAAYVEPAGAFNIAENTLAPRGDRYLTPWARSDQPGYRGGGNRFDLERWDAAYFQRLREFVTEAGRQKVIVEVNLFCPFYEESQWRLSPFHADNNSNGAGRDVARTNVYTLDRHGGLLAYQERFVRRVVAELRNLDNFYFEICNEAYFGGVTLDWQDHIAAVINDAQSAHPEPKLISQNIANQQARIDSLRRYVSIYNFHYASPPDAVGINWKLNRPIGDNETGFRGTSDAPYRMEAWDFILAGGALFSHLDYSFTVGHEDGTFAYPPTQPGGGGPALRKQFRVLRDFIEGFDFVKMAPDSGVIVGGVPPSHSARALSDPDRATAIYLRPLPVSQFSVRWTGLLEVPEPGHYQLHARFRDGLRVWVDDRLVANQWTERPESDTAIDLDLAAGQRQLKIEHFANNGPSMPRLNWAQHGKPPAPIPPTVFRLPDGSGEGLRGEYFVGRDFKQVWKTRQDPGIDFQWGPSGPFALTDDVQPIRLRLDIPGGAWQATWIDPGTGSVLKEERVRHNEGNLVVQAPTFRDDIALKLIRR